VAAGPPARLRAVTRAPTERHLHDPNVARTDDGHADCEGNPGHFRRYSKQRMREKNQDSGNEHVVLRYGRDQQVANILT
jgi:hypothetical protein